MCWTPEVTAAMVGAGAIATAITLRKREVPIVPFTLAFFTLMEGLQLFGYTVIDQCGTPANETVTLLSILHIVFQPLVINAFAMALMSRPISLRMKTVVYGLCGLSSVVMLIQLYPFSWAGSCEDGAILCAKRLCTVTGDWHQAWDVPYNGLMTGWDRFTHWGFPTYMVAVFAVPLLYGAWRFVLMQALFGPVLAGALTSNPNEVPAIWCLFSIGLTLIALSPVIRRQVMPRSLA
jgi:hypothetical protein